MKKLIFALMSIFSIVSIADAQKKTSGAIQFETTVDPAAMASASGIQLTDQQKARMSSAVKTNFELLFTATNASYMPVEEVEDSNGAGGGGNGGGMGRMMMRFGGGGGNREYYYTFADQKLTEVFDLNDTTYYMPSKLTLSTSGPIGSMRMGGNRAPGDTAKAKPVAPPTIEIVKTDSTKKILGFTCKQVIVRSTRAIKLLDMDKNVVEETKIWYTNELGFNFSPNPNMWTEGTVLAIEGRGNSSIAKSIEYRNVSAKDVTAPKKAKLITEEEYKTKMENMMKRFRNNRPPGGGGQIRTFGMN
ncbi:hypothetical protein [Pedobacter paludis]|uniref:GLPGLI family protein n=1 Tax=Pedobacter paludis TaxID=2203212 RepID=A0A317F6U7_9SPHI|nr:hypothetical protein [Pedobacter paludis]PWS33649.1 hypothetical protein DF947_03275 [Pedobacter paludis]